MVYSFYFLCFGFSRNEFNSLWEEKGGEVRKLLLARKMYHPEDSVFSLTNSKNNGGCHFTKKVQKSPLYLSYILIQECLGILAAKCASCNVWHALIKTMYCDNIMINVSCTVIACSIILSSVKLEKSQHSGESIRISHDLLTIPPYPFQRLLHSFLLEPTSRK